MGKYSTEEQIHIAKFYYLSQGFTFCIERVSHHYKTRDRTSDSGIRGIISRFETQGSVNDLPRIRTPHTAKRQRHNQGYEGEY